MIWPFSNRLTSFPQPRHLCLSTWLFKKWEATHCIIWGAITCCQLKDNCPCSNYPVGGAYLTIAYFNPGGKFFGQKVYYSWFFVCTIYFFIFLFFFPMQTEVNHICSAVKEKCKSNKRELQRKFMFQQCWMCCMFLFQYKLPLVPYADTPLRGHVNTQGEDFHRRPLCLSVH